MKTVIAQFGPFRLNAPQRLLEKNGVPVPLGSRALDMLIALVESAPSVVSKRELLARVWPNLVVDEGNLRFQVAVLRKALGEGQDGSRYLSNVAGRGYCFVGTLSQRGEPPTSEAPGCVVASSLPGRVVDLIGREQAMHDIGSRLAAGRLVSVVGLGGVGKTALAIAVGRASLADFENEVHFIDLSRFMVPSRLPDPIAATPRAPLQASSALEALSGRLRGRRTLLILDNCEQVIDEVATLVERILSEHPQVQVLTTSREPLRIEGEQVYRLAPLECPPQRPALTAAAALDFPAVKLLVRSIAASGHPFELTDRDATAAAEICRRLDGIPLALQFAGQKVGAYGIGGVLAQVIGQQWLNWRGRRSDSPRHRTFGTNLAWSEGLLSPRERLALCRLARSNTVFSLPAAELAASGARDAALDAETLASLVDKSLLRVEGREGRSDLRCYRLLNTTRDFFSRAPRPRALHLAAAHCMSGAE